MWCKDIRDWVRPGISKSRPRRSGFGDVLLSNAPSRFWSPFKSVNDPDQIWYDLCEGGEKEQYAVRLCQKFLRLYATRRMRPRVSIEAEENEAKCTINHGRTLLNILRLLALHFNHTVLICKGREDPANASRLDLRFKEGVYAKKCLGPAYEIIRVRHLYSHSISTYTKLRYLMNRKWMQ